MSRCYECGMVGHERMHCPNIECRRCRQKGHMARSCPQSSRTFSPTRQSSADCSHRTSNAHRLPSHWKINDEYGGSIADSINGLAKEGKKYVMHDTDPGERREVEELMLKTWRKDLVGLGVDARNLSHTDIQVETVERIENPEKYEKYSQRKHTLLRPLRGAEQGERVFTRVDKLPGSSGPVLTTRHLQHGGFLRGNVYLKINEHYLFHGTKREHVVPIARDGMDNRFGSQGSLLGPGLYMAECCTKSDQYADGSRQDRTDELKKMFLVRVLLGEPYLNQLKSPPRFPRPPCKSCIEIKCGCQHAGQYDSVIDDAGRLFREFVVYEQCQCYPEYLITYRRVKLASASSREPSPLKVHTPSNNQRLSAPQAVSAKRAVPVIAANVQPSFMAAAKTPPAVKATIVVDTGHAAGTGDAAAKAPSSLSSGARTASAAKAQYNTFQKPSWTTTATSCPPSSSAAHAATASYFFAEPEAADSNRHAERVGIKHVWSPGSPEAPHYSRGRASPPSRSNDAQASIDCPSCGCCTAWEPGDCTSCGCCTAWEPGDCTSCGCCTAWEPGDCTSIFTSSVAVGLLSIGCVLVILLTFTIAAAMMVYGFLHAGDCPAVKFIPIYLQLDGMLTVWGFLVIGACYVWSTDDRGHLVVFFLGPVAFVWFALQMAGWVVVFQKANTHFNSSDNYCSAEFFRFTLWTSSWQMGLYVLSGLSAVYLLSHNPAVLSTVMHIFAGVAAAVGVAALLFFVALPFAMIAIGSHYHGDCSSPERLPGVLIGVGVVTLLLFVASPVSLCILGKGVASVLLGLAVLFVVVSVVTCQALGYVYLYPYNDAHCNTVIYTFAYTATALVNILYFIVPAAGVSVAVNMDRM